MKDNALKVFGDLAYGALTKQKAVAAICLMLFIMLFFKTSFYTRYNILALLRDSSINVIIALGVTVAVICGGCDLSVGSMMCLSGILAVRMLNSGASIPLAMAAGILSGCLVGFINGFFIVQQRTEAFIITLGMGILLKGVCQQLTDAQPIACKNLSFMKIANGRVGQVPNLVIIMLVLGVLVYCLPRYTSFGRNCYAIGGDYEVAKYSGINVILTKWMAFILSGAAAAAAGVLLSSRLNTGSSIYGDETALMVNCAIVVGGTSFAGGVGGVVQSFIGIMVLQILLNCMNMLGVPPYIQLASQGAVIVMIIWMDCFGRKIKREAV
jgi:ribose transport system permease protein